MKTIGLIGGMSWESTVSYYQTINQIIKEQRGGLHSAKILLFSVDFHEIETCQLKGDWEKSAVILTDAAKRLEKAGADFIVICTNTMHKVVPQIQASIQLPILHIAEATANRLKEQKITKVGLLGTKYTLKESFYKDIIKQANIEVIIPTEVDIEKINKIIFEELCLGIIRETSKQAYLRIVDKLSRQGIQGIILGCTEIGLLIQQQDLDLPVFDTAKIHSEAAALNSLRP